MNNLYLDDIACPTDLLNYFLTIAPIFKGYWSSEDNYSIEENGNFTFCGVCSEFAHYFIEQEKFFDKKKAPNIWVELQPSMKETSISELFIFIEKILEKNTKSKLEGSLKVCFLEDISQTKAGEESKKWMGKLSREFFDKWHVYP